MKNNRKGRIVAIICVIIIGLAASIGGSIAFAHVQNELIGAHVSEQTAEPLYEHYEENGLGELVTRTQVASIIFANQFKDDVSSEYWDNYTEFKDYLTERAIDYYVKDLNSNQEVKGIQGYDEAYILKHKDSFQFYLKLRINKDGSLSVDEIDKRFSGDLTKVNYYDVYTIKSMMAEREYEDEIISASESSVPQNMTIYLYSDQDLFYNECRREAADSIFNTPQDIYRQYGIDLYAVAGLLLFVAAAAAAAIFICIPWFGLRDSFLKKLPIEVSIIFGGLATVIYMAWIVCVMENVYIDNATDLYLIGSGTVRFAAWLAPILLVTYMLAFFCVGGIMGLFIDGPKTYFLKRSLIGRLCVLIFKKVQRLELDVRTIYADTVKYKSLAGVIAIYLAILIGGVFLCQLFALGLLGADIFNFVLIAIFLIIYGIVVFRKIMGILHNYHRDYDVVSEMVDRLSEGDLDAEISQSAGGFDSLLAKLTSVREGVRKAAEKEVQSEKMKTELITNVSHDLKTPLTAIITYTDLLKNDQLSDEDRRHYVDILDQKSYKLKKLIEDLFEVSKANSGTINVDLAELNVTDLVQQAIVENEDLLGQAHVSLKVNLPQDKVIMKLDGAKMYRILDNLLVNVSKYSMPGTRAYITMEETAHKVTIAVKNVSANELPEDVSQLTERFVRGDESRHTEGSGLGLAICKSYVEVMGGQFEIMTDGDLFKAVITLNK